MENIFVYIFKERKQYSFIASEAEKIFSKKHLKIFKDDFGKPWFNEQGIYLSISDTEDYFVFGLSKIPFGIDIERYRDIAYKQFNRLFSYEESAYILKSKDKNKAFFRVWTEKEAYIKFDGRGLGILPSVDTFDIRLVSNYKHIFGLNFVVSIFAKFNYEIKLIKTQTVREEKNGRKQNNRS